MNDPRESEKSTKDIFTNCAFSNIQKSPNNIIESKYTVAISCEIVKSFLFSDQLLGIIIVSYAIHLLEPKLDASN